jgi:hypothetical protein
MSIHNWYLLQPLSSQSWTCGHCGRDVGGNLGYYRNDGKKIHPNLVPQPGAQLPPAAIDESVSRILICPECAKPTYFEEGRQVPGTAYGRQVLHLPPDIDKVYGEARACMSVDAFLPAVLTARTILMHIAVEQKAEEGKDFVYYVDFLVKGGFVPPNATNWVDHIRKKGNAATHRIALMGREDAEKVLRFIEMILLFLYEYPSNRSRVEGDK